MTLADWCQIIQTLGVIGALGGLVYQLRLTAEQMRQTEKSMQAAAYQGLIQQIQDLHVRLAENEPTAQLIAGHLAPGEDNRPQDVLLALSLLNVLESAHFQHLQGTIPDKLWEGWLQQVPLFFAVPTMASLWKTNATSYNEEFRRTIELHRSKPLSPKSDRPATLAPVARGVAKE